MLPQCSPGTLKNENIYNTLTGEIILKLVFCFVTDKVLKEVIERILQTSYFDSTHNHQNGLCEEEEIAPAPAVEDSVAEAGK